MCPLLCVTHGHMLLMWREWHHHSMQSGNFDARRIAIVFTSLLFLFGIRFGGKRLIWSFVRHFAIHYEFLFRPNPLLYFSLVVRSLFLWFCFFRQLNCNRRKLVVVIVVERVVRGKEANSTWSIKRLARGRRHAMTFT